MKSIIAMLMLIALMGCGSVQSTSDNDEPKDLPKAPNIAQKDKVPPSIPAI